MKADKHDENARPLPSEQRAAKQAKRRSRDRITTLVLLAVFALGMGILLYPTVSDWYNSYHQSRVVATYVEHVETMDSAEAEAILAAAHAYNDSLPLGVRLRLSDEDYAEYERQLDITGNGIMGYIDIPAINVSLPVYHGTDEDVLQQAIGHLAGTSLPVGGQNSHCVVSGHRGLPSARLFTDLDELKEGDIFTFTVLTEKFTYMVDQIRIVLPAEVDELAIEAGHDYCTLVTCTPYGINTHRILVRGHRIDNLPDAVITPDATRLDSRLIVPVIAAPILLVLLALVLIRGRKKAPPRTKEQLLAELRQANAPKDQNES